MQIPLSQPQPSSPKAATVVKNILIRHSCSKETRWSRNYEHPEISRLLKYAPKYYHSLTTHTTLSHPLLSKIKKIKKLKKFTGVFLKVLPHKLWLNLLTNNRKEIEEIPHIIKANPQLELSESFWQRLNLHKIKLLPNMKRVSLPTRKWDCQTDDNDSFISIKEVFIKYIRNMRRLKNLQIDMGTEDLLSLLHKLRRLQPEIFSLRIQYLFEEEFPELLLKKNVFSQLTGLRLEGQFHWIYGNILQFCKSLKSLSFSFVSNPPEFQDFLTSIQNLSQLKSLQVDRAGNGWGYFTPPSSLRSLQLAFSSSSCLKDLSVDHWEEIAELDFLEINIRCGETKELRFVRLFITMILKKIRKLRSLKLSFSYLLNSVENIPRYEPFFIAEVPHLYESLERFEFAFKNLDPRCNWNISPSRFDLGIMKPFSNLKQLGLQSWGAFFGNVKEAVNLLQENQKEGDYPTLEFKLEGMTDQDRLGDFLKAIQKIKRVDKNVKIVLTLSFKKGRNNYAEILERLCRDIHAVKSIEGLEIHLRHRYDLFEYELSADEVRENLEKYPSTQNLTILLSNGYKILEYIKLDGQKQQFYVDSFEYEYQY